MGWYSEKYSDFSNVLIAAGRARQHHKECKDKHKERGNRLGSDGFSEYFWGFHPLYERRCALRFKASAVAV
jgi:hypothetical protein